MKRIIFLLALILTVTACGQSAGQLNNKGNRAFAAGDYAAALEAYQSAQAQAPDVAEPYYNAANSYYRQENYRQAALQAEQSLRTADDTLAEYGYYNLGNSYFNNQKFKQAVKAYKQALRLNPNDTDAKHNLELALQKLQQNKQQKQQNGNNGQQPPSTPTPSPTPTPVTGRTPQAQKTPSAQPTPDPSGQGQQGDNQPQQGQGQPSKPQQLTADQARRLLESIAGDTKTLQQKLMELYGTPPAESSGEDW